MRSKRVKKRFERLQAIQDRIVVAVDPAKKKHQIMVFAPNRVPMGQPFKIFNEGRGFAHLLRRVNQYAQQVDHKGIIFAIEPSAHYWLALAYYLDKRSYQILLVPGLVVKRAREIENQTTSHTDPKDAYLIGNLVQDGKYSQANLPDGVYAELRNSAGLWHYISGQRSAVKQKIHTLLDVYFPEYPDIFSDILGASSRYLLRNYPFPEDWAEVNLVNLGLELIRISRGQIDQERAKTLKKLATESVGISEGTNSARTQLKLLLEQVEMFDRQLYTIARELKSLLKQTGYDQQLLSLPGVGIISAALLLGELGDFARYSHAEQIIKMAGLDLILRESGSYIGQRRISKRGRSLLRKVLFQIAVRCVRLSNRMRKKYLQGLVNKKPKKKVIVSVIPLFVKIMFACVKEQRLYQKDEGYESQIAYLERVLAARKRDRKRNSRALETVLV